MLIVETTLIGILVLVQAHLLHVAPVFQAQAQAHVPAVHPSQAQAQALLVFLAPVAQVRVPALVVVVQVFQAPVAQVRAPVVQVVHRAIAHPVVHLALTTGNVIM
jgi:hypothetical protein